MPATPHTTRDSLFALIEHRLQGSIMAMSSLTTHVVQLAVIAELIIKSLQSGGTVFTCGNGGSAAQSLHLAEELIGRYRGNRPPLRAVCLNGDPTALTCIANDFGFEQVFARQCEALVNTGDVLVTLSTSGQSPNIIAGLKAARARGAITIGLLGKDGGACKSLCDHPLIVAGSDSAHIQEAHQVVIHLICEAVERAF